MIELQTEEADRARRRQERRRRDRLKQVGQFAVELKHITTLAVDSTTVHPVTVITKDDTAYCGYYQPEDFDIPSKYDAFMPIPPLGCNIQWAHNRFPYLAWIPSFPRLSGPLFGRLAIDASHPIPYECYLEHEGGERKWFRMLPNVRDSWIRLEGILINACHLLKPHVQYRDYTNPRPPGTFGYDRPKDNASDVRRSIVRARDAFIVLMALLSFLIAQLDDICDFVGPSPHRELGHLPKWIHILALQNKMHFEYINMLFMSEVCNWTIIRVGSVVDLKACSFAGLIPTMIRRKVALVYKWDVENLHYLVDEYLPEYIIRNYCFPGILVEDCRTRLLQTFMALRPPEHIVARARARERGTMTNATDPMGMDVVEEYSSPSWRAGTSRITTSTEFPTLDPRSGQLPYETRKQFNVRRCEENKMMLREESEVERARRQSIELNGIITGAPSWNDGSKIFFWEYDHGYEVRRQRPYSECQRCFKGEGHEFSFDPFRKEWDIWSSFDRPMVFPIEFRYAEDYYDDDDDDDDDNHDHNGDSQVSFAANTHAPDTPFSLSFERDCVLDILASLQLNEGQILPTGHSFSAELIAQRESLENDLRIRYGYFWRAEVSYIAPTTTSKTQEYDIEKIKKISIVHLSHNDPSQSEHIKNFFTHLMNEHTVPFGLWDMANISVRDFGNPRLFACATAFSSCFPIHFQTLPQPVYRVHVLSDREDDEDWKLFVSRAATAVEILRLTDGEYTSCRASLARYLVMHGIPFITARHVTRCEASTHSVTYTPLLGRRCSPYKPDALDYAIYEKKRNEFLRTPRARKLLRIGGIHARIARGFYESNGMEIEVEGPSPDARKSPHELVDTRSSEVQLIDDGLSMEELDLVSGVYEVFKGNSKDRPIYFSWWPRYGNWNGSGLDVGRWTSDCEDWYQLRLKAIRSSSCSLVQGKDWRQRLKFQKKTSSLTKKYEQICADFICGRRFC